MMARNINGHYSQLVKVEWVMGYPWYILITQEKGNLIVEKWGRPYLNQVIEVAIETKWHQEPVDRLQWEHKITLVAICSKRIAWGSPQGSTGQTQVEGHSAKCNLYKSQGHKTLSRETESCDWELKSLLASPSEPKLKKGMGENYTVLYTCSILATFL